MTRLCEVCSSLDFAAISKAHTRAYFGVHEGFPRNHDIFYYDIVENDKVDLSDFDRRLIPYHESLQSLATAATLCGVCTLVHESALRVIDGMARARGSGYNYIDTEQFQFLICGRSKDSGFNVLAPDSHPNNSKINVNGTEIWRFYKLMAVVEFRVEEGNELANFIKGRSIPESPRDVGVVRKFKQWIRDCVEDHHHDDREPCPPLPTRVLHISDDASMFKVEITEGKMGEYTVLSHCWGSSQPITMTSSNMEELQGGMQVSELPQTFKDAVWMTHALGYRRLWIDSLCIKQDDIEDWRRESALMHTVYRNAVVSLSASRAADSSEGFLGPRVQPHPVIIPYHVRDESGTVSLSGHVQAYPLPLKYEAFSTRITEFEDEPLSDRGWALQERLMAPRVLHFTRTQTFFDCKRHMLSDDNQTDLYDAVKAGDLVVFRGWLDQYVFEDHWKRLATLYSRRKLTFPSDKLPAMAGMAAYFAQGVQEVALVTLEKPLMKPRRYLAGIWLPEDSVAGLCWQIDDDLGVGCRPSEYRAPTWAWTSLDGPINWEQVNVELATVLEAHVELQSPTNIFGQVLGGWLRLKAFIYRPYSAPDDGDDRDVITLLTIGNIDMWVRAIWDTDSHKVAAEGQPPSSELGETDLIAVVMGCMILSDDSYHSLVVLLAKPVPARVSNHPQTPAFERLGLAMAIPGRRGEEYTVWQPAFRDLVDNKLQNNEEGMQELILL